MSFTQKEEKLWRLALDPAAKDGEVANAAAALIRSLRDRNASAYDTRPPSAAPQRAAQPEAAPARWYTETDWPGTVIMPFGKYKGRRLAEIDPGYFRWCIANLDEDRSWDLMNAMRWLLEDLQQRQRRK